MSINERVKIIRESLGLDKSPMARRLKMSPQTYGSIENGEGGVSMANIKKIATSLENLNLRWLLFESGEIWLSENLENYEKSDLIKSKVSENDPPQYEHQKASDLIEKKELEQKRWELAMIEIEALRRRVELLEKEAKRKR